MDDDADAYEYEYDAECYLIAASWQHQSGDAALIFSVLVASLTEEKFLREHFW